MRTGCLVFEIGERRVASGERRRLFLLAALLLACSPMFSCHREQRTLITDAAGAHRTYPVRISGLQPGPRQLGQAALNNPYEGNAQAISDGQKLFEQYNCSGCHFHGGGGIGPPLMDEEWIYGSSPANIYLSISEGRPNGMPSFGGHIPDAQIWEIVTYVRALGGFESQPATSPRSDEMQARRTEEPKP